MKKLRIDKTSLNIWVVLTLLALAATSSHAATRTWDGSTSTDYNEPTNWSADDVPDADDSGVLDGGGTGVTLLSGGVTPSNAQALNIRGGHVFNIDNAGGSLTVGANVNMGRGATADGSAINHSAGAFNIGGLDMGGNPTGGTSTYTLSGTASLSIAGGAGRDLDIGGDVGNGDYDTTFAIDGDAATVTATGAPVVLRSSAILDFTLGATGTDAIDTSGNFTMQSGAALIVDGSSYTGGVGTIPLFTYATRTDATEFTTENITGFGALSADVVYDEDSIDLVLTLSGAAQVTSFTADVTQVSSGDPVTLSWTTSNATTVTLDPGAMSVAANDSTVVNPTTTTTYTLTASDGVNSHFETIEILVGPRINSLTADNTVTNVTNGATLSWDVENATILTLDPGGIDVSGQTSEPVGPLATTTYTLTASDGVTSVQETIEIVIEPEIFSFTADAAKIALGDSVTLSWDVLESTSLTLDPGGMDVTSAGELGDIVLSPTTTTTYTLIAANADASVQAEVTVEVGPTINSFLPDASRVLSGGDVTFSWSVDDFTTLTLDPGGIDVSAETSQLVTNITENTTFTLTASDGTNSVSEEYTIVLLNAAPPTIVGAPVISVNFHAADNDFYEDHEITIGETAGFIPVDGEFWTNINVGAAQAHGVEPIFSSTQLIDDTGDTNAATIVPSVDSSYFVGYAASAASDGLELELPGNDDDLFNSYLALNGPSGDGSPADAAVLNVSGLGSAYTSGGYTLIVYSDSDRRNTSTNTRQSLFTLTPAGGSPVTAFVEDDDAEPGVNIFDGLYVFSDYVDDGADYSNFVIFEGLTATSFDLEISSPGTGGRGAISGFQIVGGTGLPVDPLQLTIANAANGTDLDFTWNSAAGMSYNLRSNTTLGTDPMTWSIVPGQDGIVATEPTNTLTLTRPADPKTFYVLEEFPTPAE